MRARGTVGVDGRNLQRWAVGRNLHLCVVGRNLNQSQTVGLTSFGRCVFSRFKFCYRFPDFSNRSATERLAVVKSGKA